MLAALALALVTLVASLFPRTSFAQTQRIEDAPCAPETIAWITRADAAIDVSIESAACPTARALLTLRPTSGAAMQVEIAEPPGPAFRHAGRLRVSPILEVSDFKLVPAPEREAFEALYAWLVAHEREVVIAPAPPKETSRVLRRLAEAPADPGFPAGLLVVVGLLFAAIGGRFHAGFSKDEPSPKLGLGLFFGALALRIVLGPFAPHHVNGQGPLWILAALEDPSRLASYGPGYVEVFSIVTRLWPRPDTALFLANAAISAAAAPLVLALALGVGLDRRRAIAAAAVVAVDPVSIRMGATEAYFPAIITLTLAAAVALVSASRHAIARRTGRALALAFAAALFAAQASRFHPVAWGPAMFGPLFVPAAVLASAGERRMLAKAGWAIGLTLAAVLVLGLVVLATSASSIARVAGNVGVFWDAREALTMLVAFVRANAPIIAAVGALALALVRPRAVLLPALAAVVAIGMTARVYGQSELWRDSYVRLWVVAPLLALVSFVPEKLSRTRVAPFALGLVLVLRLGRGRATLQDRTTEQLEYRFFREAFTSLPSGCRVAYVMREANRVVFLPEQALGARGEGPRAAVNVRGPEDVLALQPTSPCLRYAHTSICTSADGRPSCERVERGLDLVPRERATFHARPSHEQLPYDRDSIDVVLYEVRGPAAR